MCLYEPDTGFRSIGFEVELILNRLRNARQLSRMTKEKHGAAKTETASECRKREREIGRVDRRESEIDTSEDHVPFHSGAPKDSNDQDTQSENNERTHETDKSEPSGSKLSLAGCGK